MNEADTSRPSKLFPLAPITVVVGHYGVGKTNFSLNLAFDAARSGKQVTLVDLDIVNPYFRSSDYRDRLEEAAIKLISPVFSGSSLDAPSLSGAIYPVLESADEGSPVILDVGGDDAGATALGRFAEAIGTHGYTMLYVVNAYRNLTQKPEEAALVLREIEQKSGLRATALVNNSHLQSETTAELVAASNGFAERTAELLGLPLAATTLPAGKAESKEACRPSTGAEPRSSVHLSTDASQNSYIVQRYVRTPWEQ